MKPRKRTKPSQLRARGPQRDLAWLCSLLHDIYGMRLAFVSEAGYWVGPHHAKDQVILDDSTGPRLADGTPLLSMMSLDEVLAGLRLPDIPAGFTLDDRDAAGVRWVCLKGLMTLVKASHDPDMEAVWASWLADGGDDLEQTRPEARERA